VRWATHIHTKEKIKERTKKEFSRNKKRKKENTGRRTTSHKGEVWGRGENTLTMKKKQTHTPYLEGKHQIENQITSTRTTKTTQQNKTKQNKTMNLKHPPIFTSFLYFFLFFPFLQ
jgi:hypothetical protein